jgi:hypothetical protein
MHIYTYYYNRRCGSRWKKRNVKEGPSGQIISLRAPDDKQSMSLDLMSGASVEEIQASLGGVEKKVFMRGWIRMNVVT